MEALGGGCQTPLGALASPAVPDTLELVAIVTSLDGGRAIRATGIGLQSEARALGRRVGADLIARGAGEILAEAEAEQARS